MGTFSALYQKLQSILFDNTPGYYPSQHDIEVILLEILAALAALEEEGKL